MLLIMNALPCLLVPIVWWTQRNDGSVLPSWRRSLLSCCLLTSKIFRRIEKRFAAFASHSGAAVAE